MDLFLTSLLVRQEANAQEARQAEAPEIGCREVGAWEFLRLQGYHRIVWAEACRVWSLHQARPVFVLDKPQAAPGFKSSI